MVCSHQKTPPQLCAGGEKPSELGWHVALIPQYLLAQLWGKRSRKGRSQEPFREGRAGSGRAGSVGESVGAEALRGTHGLLVAAVTPGAWPLLCHPNGPDPALQDLSRPHSG